MLTHHLIDQQITQQFFECDVYRFEKVSRPHYFVIIMIRYHILVQLLKIEIHLVVLKKNTVDV